MPFNVAIVAEGPTDVAVIENIVSGITGTADNNFTYLRPEITRGPTAPSKLSNWSQVLAYCATNEFRGAFAFQDFVVIQIDTDHHDPVHFNLPAQEGGQETTQERKREFARAILIEQIGSLFYESVQDRIVFAVCVDSIECWLLPLFFPSMQAKRAKTRNCFETLITHNETRALEKSYAWYQTISKPLAKRRKLDVCIQHQLSLAYFITDLEECLQQFPSDEASGKSNLQT